MLVRLGVLSHYSSFRPAIKVNPVNGFAVTVPAFCGKRQEDYNENKIVDKNLKRKGELGDLSNISYFVRKHINEEAYKKGMSNDAYLRNMLKGAVYSPKIATVESKSANVGRTRVTTLMDGEQIFNKTLEYIKSADKSIQVEMFEFQNLTIDGRYWTLNGAKNVPGAREQQQILGMLVKKKEENPNIKIQVILDAHKWYIDSKGKNRHYANVDMMRYLKSKGIDVVPYPRASQQGASLQHVKLLTVDGKKAIIGGMNWGTHSAANHDACVAIETRPQYSNSEVDNIVENQFNKDWKFAWQRLGATPLISGPLTEEEQQNYHGIDKEIKEENVQYKQLLGDLFDTEEMRNRYKEGKLDLISANPVGNPKIELLGTKPKELRLVGEDGVEATRAALMEKVKTCKKMRAETFVLTDKELVQTIIKRSKDAQRLAEQSGKSPKEFFDAEFIVEPDIIEKFPYCENAFASLKANGIDIRTYNVDESIHQRMHAKWAVFDDKDIIIGSTNFSAAGLNQNLDTGLRSDYILNTENINKDIKATVKEVSTHEDLLNLPHVKWNGTEDSYKLILNRRKIYSKALTDLHKKGEAEFKINNVDYKLVNDENRSAEAELFTIQGFYGIIKARYNAQEKYKRGNNEVSIMFSSPLLAQNVFQKQFNLDWKKSESEFDKAKDKPFEIGAYALKS